MQRIIVHRIETPDLTSGIRNTAVKGKLTYLSVSRSNLGAEGSNIQSS